MGDNLTVAGAPRFDAYAAPGEFEAPEALEAAVAQYFSGLAGWDSSDAFRSRNVFDSGDRFKYFFNAELEAPARTAAPTRPPIDGTTYSTPNYGNSRHGADIDTIILHHTGTGKKGSGSLAATTAHFANPNTKVSAHYIVDRDGKIYQLVGDEKRAWHAGRGSLRGDGRDLNDRAIGIEIVNDGTGTTAFTEAQYRALEQLVPYLADKYGVPARNVVGHKDVSSEGKPDPAPNFDMARILRSVNGEARPTEPPRPDPTPRPTPTPRPQTPPRADGAGLAPQAELRRGQRGANVLALQSALVKAGYMTLDEVQTGAGTFGPRTFAAVQKFQRDHDLPDTGFYGPLTRAALSKALKDAPAAPQVNLERGQRGADVFALQAALVREGYLTLEQVGTGPGVFGARTFAAVQKFQRDHGVPATGFYGPLTRAALAKALGGDGATRPTRPAPTNPTNDAPPPTAEAARNVNRILRGTGLEGKGELMLRLSKKYDIPVELALAMFRKEASFNRFGYAPQNNNPGNIRFKGQAGAVRGAGGFAKWGTLDEGIEAYFKLLNGPTYRKFVDRKDWDGLVNVYAPPSENDTGLYVRQVKQWITQYHREIYGGGGAQSPAGPRETPRADNRETVRIKPYVIYSGSKHVRSYGDLPPHHDYQQTGRGEVRDFTLIRWGKPNTGHAIPSPMRGVVTRAGWFGGYGNAVEVTNQQTGERFIIGHMNSIGVKKGDRVEYGQDIGTQGTTGNSTGPHIHIEAPTHIIRRYITDLLDGSFERVGRDYAK